MVIWMDMQSGERFYDEPQEAVGSAYDDEVLNANLVPPELALAFRRSPLPSNPAPTDVVFERGIASRRSFARRRRPHGNPEPAGPQRSAGFCFGAPSMAHLRVQACREVDHSERSEAQLRG